MVKKGQLLVILHHQDIKLNIKSLLTDLSLERAKRTGLEGEKSVFNSDLASRLETQQVKIRSMEQEGLGGEARLVFITHAARERDLRSTLQDLRSLDAVRSVGSVLRVIGD